MTFLRVLAIGLIFIATAVGWFVLGGAVAGRTRETGARLGQAVGSVWGPPLAQSHPVAWHAAPAGRQGRREVAPASSAIRVELEYAPKRKGLLWYRAYDVSFEGRYEIPNPSPIAQTIYVQFKLPDKEGSYSDLVFAFGGQEHAAAAGGVLTAAAIVPAGGSVPLQVGYRCRGLDRWEYGFGPAKRVAGFRLEMTTNFAQIDFPEGGSSPTSREREGAGWRLVWDYPDVLGARPVAMEMPKVLNAGPVAARISFFAPVSLLFFFAVLLLLGMVRGQNLHPMNYFFLAAGCFAFQLLFAYLVDLLPLHASFAVAALVSVGLVSGYVHVASGGRLTGLCLAAQLAYMVLFSYSFFFDGLTGLTITVGAVVTLAVLMVATARVDWGEKFRGGPPPLPGEAGPKPRRL